MIEQPYRPQPSYLRSTARFTIAASLLAFALAACHAPEIPQDPAGKHDSTSPMVGSAKHMTSSQTSPLATNPAAAAALATGAGGYQELLQRYPTAQQTIIKSWYVSYAADSMSFTSNAQWQWMQQHDYPTPDDVLRASMMTEAQLRDMAVRGDAKANFFYLARLLDDYESMSQASTAPSQDNAHLQVAMSASMDRALATGSAFAGYMYGSYYAALHGKKMAGIGTVCGLAWARSLGDTRTDLILSKQMGFPGVSGVRAAEAYFDMFAAAARVNPYFLNTRRGQGGLFIPLQ